MSLIWTFRTSDTASYNEQIFFFNAFIDLRIDKYDEREIVNVIFEKGLY